MNIWLYADETELREALAADRARVVFEAIFELVDEDRLLRK